MANSSAVRMSLLWPSRQLLQYALLVLMFALGTCSLIVIVAGSLAIFSMYLMEEVYVLTPVALVALSGCVLAASFYGCSGTLRNDSSSLQAFCLLIASASVLQVAAGIAMAVLGGSFAAILRSQMLATLAEYGVQDRSTWIWDEMQNQVRCCGIDTYRDWWNNTAFKTIPRSCYDAPADEAGIVVWDRGCYTELVYLFGHNCRFVVAVLMASSSVQWVAVYAAYALSKRRLYLAI